MIKKTLLYSRKQFFPVWYHRVSNTVYVIERLCTENIMWRKVARALSIYTVHHPRRNRQGT